jgi:excisionase family DNA binding protein
MTEPTPQGPMTTGQAAIAIGVHYSTIIRYVNTGKLDAVILPSGHRRVTQESVDTMLNNRA